MNGRSKQVTRKGLEEQIGRTLYSRIESIQVTSADIEGMRHSAHRKVEGELGMRKWNVRRVFVMMAAVYILGTITAAATGKVIYTSD